MSSIKGDKLKFQIVDAKNSGDGRRHILVNRENGNPMIASSIYEAHLKSKTDSHNTRILELYHFAHLYSWADLNQVNIDRYLLNGQGLTASEIRSFASWIKSTRTNENGIIPHSKRKGINQIFSTCCALSVWFIHQYSIAAGSNRNRIVQLEMLIQAQNRIWSEVKVKVSKNPVAPDLTEEEISKIEQFLKPINRSRSVGEAIAVRDYLIWRMAIEFGMRKGEILSMRTIDCPTKNAPYFKIIRIEERESDYIDPRKNPPRPKTLSRELGIILKNSSFPRLVSEYISVYRYKLIKKNGKSLKQFLLPHNFLITSNKGDPLTIRAADEVAKAIRAGTGVDFNWHLARHAFFNRAYEAVAKVKERNEQRAKFTDLVLWGGWSSEKSLDIYTRRARADRARNALTYWQEGTNEWIALS